MNSPDSLIRARGISLQIGGRPVLEHVDVEVSRGEIVTLIGPNGSGKTSFVRLVLGLLKADAGKLQRKKGLRVGYMPQKLHIDPVLPITVERFIQLAGAVPKKEFDHVVARVGISPLLDKPVQNVSGGEFQRVLLARALVRKPDLLVLDEPAQGVDINGQQELYKLIATIRDEYGCGVLMVSHDLHLVMEATDQVLCLNTHICCTGRPEAVSQHPEYLKLFGSSLDGLAVYTHHHDHTHDLHGDVVESEEHDHG
jgi:zinc transport system ATP-binding protein